MEILFSDSFKKEYKKIRDSATRARIIKALKALAENPEKGKNLSNVLHGKKSVRIASYRLIYEYHENRIAVYCFDPKKYVYKQ